MAFAEILDVFLADFGVPVLFAGAPSGALGIEDFHDVEAFDENSRPVVLGRDRTLLVKTSVASLLASGDTVTVNGTDRVVREQRAIEDGAFTLLFLRSRPDE